MDEILTHEFDQIADVNEGSESTGVSLLHLVSHSCGMPVAALTAAACWGKWVTKHVVVLEARC